MQKTTILHCISNIISFRDQLRIIKNQSFFLDWFSKLMIFRPFQNKSYYMHLHKNTLLSEILNGLMNIS